jgi:hypothetical protein
MKPDTILGSFNFAVDDRDWIKDRTKVLALVDAVLTTELGKTTRFAGVQGATKKAESPEAIRALIATAKSDVFVLTQDKKAPRVTTLLTITPTALGVEVRCYDEELAARRATLLDDVLAVPLAIRAAGCVGGLRFGYVTPVVRALAAYVYPRPRPPRRHDVINIGAIVDTIDLTFHQSGHADASEAARKMAASELPKEARRDERDGLVLLRWASELDDTAALDRGCAAHEEWIASLLPTTIEGNFNELGDAAEPMRGLEDRAGMTKYDPRAKTAYVAVVVFPDGEPEAHHWGTATDLARRRAAADGTPVERVRIIAPLRELALRLGKQSKAHGIDAVLYPGDGGTWWNPDPPGEWAYPPKER